MILDDLQQGFADSLMLFPNGSDYRVCCISDSVWVVREISPNEEPSEIWPYFCGHLFAISSTLMDIDIGIGNRGLRVIISMGPLLQISQPETWDDEFFAGSTKNWFVLTGASEAVAKCEKAEKVGTKGGFLPRYCWHEIPDKPCHYRGTYIQSIRSAKYRQPELYSTFYERMCENVIDTVELEFTQWQLGD